MNVFMSKETRLNIRVKPKFKDDLQAVADYHGLTVSSYVHSILVKTIREEKERFNIPIMVESAGTNDRTRK